MCGWLPRACCSHLRIPFGMRVCPFCPDCDNANSQNVRPCQDHFGSNASPEGGSFGRIDAGFTSFEAQKSKGSLHGHSQLFVQCLHQHTPLIEVLRRLRTDGADIVNKYLVYKAHVCRQVYEDAELAKRRLPEREQAWPEYENSQLLVLCVNCGELILSDFVIFQRAAPRDRVVISIQ